ncbi:MAG: wax ester/triacylglycerol synthase domain-containing protein, partial [Micromonosporaceae bacterium]
MAMMPITDSMFLLGESREHPVHVAALKVFEIPPGAGPDFVAETHRRMLEHVDVAPTFRRRPRRPFSRLGQWAWTDDDQLDLEYHVRLSALPRPGRVRELLELISRLHGSLLDRHRPLWEFHIIEGLEGDRFAMYTKVHHALLDGVSALRLMRRVLSEDPNERDMAPPWVTRNDGRTSVVEATDADSERYGTPWRGLWAAAQAIGDVAGMAPALVRSISDILTDQ